MKECIICGHPYSEEHHVIFRGQQSALIESPINKIYLCYEHHRGNSGPHMNRKIDLVYKKELQERLEEKFKEKQLYEEDEIKEILNIKKKDARRIVKNLRVQIIEDEVGYEVEDIIRTCLAGRLYK